MRKVRCIRKGIVWTILLAASLIAAQGADRPNIVFVLTDDLGINDLGCYGRRDQPTSNLDRLAREGARFTSAYCAQPICSPSRAAILTGKAPARLHLTTFLPGRRDARSQKLLHPKIRQELPLEETTLAERLKAAGYATGYVGKWHLGGKGFGPLEQGFDSYFPGEANTKPSAVEGGKGEYGLTLQAERFLEENKGRPFFLYISHNNPHVPLAAQTRLVEKHKDSFNPIYAAMIETLDDSVGRVLRKLRELGLEERTIFVFTSDNGGLHVLETPNTPATHNTPFRAGKGFLYEGGLRVPLIVRWPGKIKPRVIDAPVINTDFTPTLMEMTGHEVPKGMDGRSIAALLTAGRAPSNRTFFWHFPHYTNQGGRPAGAVRQGDWKLVEHYDDGGVELFHLGRDLGERRNLADREGGRVRRLRRMLLDWRTSVGGQQNELNPDHDPALYRRLYVDVDVSVLPAARTAVELADRLRDWRAGMNAAVAR